MALRKTCDGMATSPSTVSFVLDQMRGAGMVRARKMFGEHAIYCDDRLIGLVCDDQLFIKPTDAATELEPDLEHVPPYQGAKPSMLVPPDLLEDAQRLAALVKATANALPVPKPRRAKTKNKVA